jgi:hypothetical protein
MSNICEILSSTPDTKGRRDILLKPSDEHIRLLTDIFIHHRCTYEIVQFCKGYLDTCHCKFIVLKYTTIIHEIGPVPLQFASGLKYAIDIMCILPMLDKNALFFTPLLPMSIPKLVGNGRWVLARRQQHYSTGIHSGKRVAEQGAQGLGAWCSRDSGARRIWNSHSDGRSSSQAGGQFSCGRSSKRLRCEELGTAAVTRCANGQMELGSYQYCTSPFVFSCRSDKNYSIIPCTWDMHMQNFNVTK